MRTWSNQQLAIFDWFRNGTGHLVVRARAGTGKTTTILEGLNHAQESKAVLVAFNKKIATELQQNADLTGADLTWVDLTGANLKGTCLDPEAPLPETDLSELEEKDGWYYGYRTQKSQHCGDTVYEPGKSYEAPYFSVSTKTDCHPGIYLAPLDWLQREYPNEPIVRVRAKHVLKAGYKYRAKYIEVLEDHV